MLTEGMSTALWRLIPPEHVDPHELRLTQEGVLIGPLLAHAHGAPSWCGDEHPHAVATDDGLVLEDGHHRVTVALVRGERRMLVRVLRPDNDPRGVR